MLPPSSLSFPCCSLCMSSFCARQLADFLIIIIISLFSVLGNAPSMFFPLPWMCSSPICNCECSYQAVGVLSRAIEGQGIGGVGRQSPVRYPSFLPFRQQGCCCVRPPSIHPLDLRRRPMNEWLCWLTVGSFPMLLPCARFPPVLVSISSFVIDI